MSGGGSRRQRRRERVGTGRQVSVRSLGVLGRNTGVTLAQAATTDHLGFKDLHESWGDDDDYGVGIKEPEVLQQEKDAALFAASPASSRHPSPVKRLDFVSEVDSVPDEPVVSSPLVEKKEKKRLRRRDYSSSEGAEEDFAAGSFDDFGEYISDEEVTEGDEVNPAVESQSRVKKRSRWQEAGLEEEPPKASKAARRSTVKGSKKQTKSSRNSQRVDSSEGELSTIADQDYYDEVGIGMSPSKPAKKAAAKKSVKRSQSQQGDSLDEAESARSEEDEEKPRKRKSPVKTFPTRKTSTKKTVKVPASQSVKLSQPQKSRNGHQWSRTTSSDEEEEDQLEEASKTEDLSRTVPASQSGELRSDDDVPQKSAREKSLNVPRKNRKKSRRQTLLIVEKAKNDNLLETIQSNLSNNDGLRRSGRSRFKPVKFYECEQLNYIEGPGGLPSIDKSRPVTKHVPTPPMKPRRQRKRPAKKRPVTSGDERDDDNVFYEAESGHDVPLDGQVKTIDDVSGKEVDTVVVFRPTLDMLEPISLKSSQKIAPGLTPTGALLMSHRNVTVGTLRLPPLGRKPKERAPCTETWYVASCERNCLAVRIHKTEFKLCKGDHFMVPARNSYTFHNTSTSKSATLMFTLNKPREDSNDSSESKRF